MERVEGLGNDEYIRRTAVTRLLVFEPRASFMARHKQASIERLQVVAQLPAGEDMIHVASKRGFVISGIRASPDRRYNMSSLLLYGAVVPVDYEDMFAELDIDRMMPDVRGRFEHHEHLVEGPFVQPVKPDEPPAFIEGAVGLWLPFKHVSRDWHMVE